MIVRVLALVGGLTGAAGLSQFPEYSQQYMQRLGGAVDELGRSVQRLESDARRVGLTPAEYLAALSGEGDLAAKQAGNLRADLARYDRLRADLRALEGAGPFMRAKLATHLGDRQIATRAFDAYKPAMPLTFEGAVFAGTGFLAGWAVLGFVLAALRGVGRGVVGTVRRG
ncbi:DUF2937 family protein [Allosediminivita pacifica]|uniref:DUF2937 family protein n=1 Tax=Allosediminivita pacifica TaxID=1267769 RepID=A0A2T6A1I0_9RHOB|nr:DUF2937 family protein [Allosediminivita pacifica]PTX37652.1 hypothetical protein C8N44_14811 [Allosediminivita pacifica]GGB29772.1 hypothetical protein GCM10011324_44140 [Allosediminivita pacifica]